VTRALPRLEPLRYARTGTLEVAYYEAGPSDGAVTLLLHEKLLAAQPPITVPAVTLDGLADGNFPATDGSPSARHFTGPRVHHQVPSAGHNLPQEAPNAFARAVLELQARP
jgi:pimeloyl-ACP methyl ester carboxylesterase